MCDIGEQQGMETMAPKKWSKIFVLAVVAFIALILIAFATSVELISHQRFCRSCHVMETYYDSWANSTHKDVSCGECHNSPGFSGFVKGKEYPTIKMDNIHSYLLELSSSLAEARGLGAERPSLAAASQRRHL